MKDDSSGSSANQIRKEAYVWENPYQIWLMEKTHNNWRQYSTQEGKSDFYKYFDDGFDDWKFANT